MSHRVDFAAAGDFDRPNLQLRVRFKSDSEKQHIDDIGTRIPGAGYRQVGGAKPADKSRWFLVAHFDFGNVAVIPRSNQETLIDAITHCMNDEYELLTGDLQELGFLAEDADVEPIARELREVWGSTLSSGGLNNFSFRRLTAQFNKLLFKYPIRVPERFSLVIRSLLTQEGICLTLDRDFQLLETAFPYVARRLLTDEDPALRMRLLQVVIVGGKFQWERLKDLIELAQSDARPGEPGMLARVNLVGVALDGLRLLAKDKTFRDTLLAGFRDEPCRDR